MRSDISEMFRIAAYIECSRTVISEAPFQYTAYIDSIEWGSDKVLEQLLISTAVMCV